MLGEKTIPKNFCWAIGNMAVLGLFLLSMASVSLILNRIEKSELTTREKILEIEYMIAEIGERISSS